MAKKTVGYDMKEIKILENSDNPDAKELASLLKKREQLEDTLSKG